MKRSSVWLSIVVVAMLALCAAGGAPVARAQDVIVDEAALGTSFTYQGYITKDNTPFNGNCRMIFRLYDALNGGAKIGGDHEINPVAVSNGVFTVSLNGSNQFGNNAFTGDARWLEVVVRCPVGAAQGVLPRQRITAAPFALRAVNANSADGLRGRAVAGAAPNNGQALIWNGTQWAPQNVSGGGGSTAWSQLTGVPAGFADNIDNDSGGDITAVNAGQGLSGGGNSGAVSLALNTAFTDGRYWNTTGNAGTMAVNNFVGTTDARPLAFRTNNVERARFGGNGNFGIGTTSPQARFNVVGTSWFQSDSTPLPTSAGEGIGIGFTGGSIGYIFAYDYTNSVPRNLVINHVGGYVGINTGSPYAGRLHVEGGGTTAVYGYSSTTGVHGSTGSGDGVFGSASSTGIGVYGSASSGTGVYGQSTVYVGVYGYSAASNSAGMQGRSPYIGVQGITTVDSTDGGRQGVRGDNHGSATGYAGFFYGNLRTSGTLVKAAGSFQIDHPLDPENKYLNHSFVESPDMKNIYDGVITTDGAGLAVVTLPDYFGALNRDFRYQLTVIGVFAQAIVKEKIANNQFTIQTDQPNVEVSWQVTGIRRDAYAQARPIVVEEEKPEQFRGMYLFPEGFGLTAESATAEERQAQLQAKSIGAAMGALAEPAQAP